MQIGKEVKILFFQMLQSYIKKDSTKKLAIANK
jgi:hypothetical protein